MSLLKTDPLSGLRRLWKTFVLVQGEVEKDPINQVINDFLPVG